LFIALNNVMRDEYKILGEAYMSIYNKPQPISINEGDLMLDLVSRITSSFTFMSPAYNPIQESTVKFIAQRWSEGNLKTELLKRSLDRARSQNNKSVETFLNYVESGLYDGNLKAFVIENIIPALLAEAKLSKAKQKEVGKEIEKLSHRKGFKGNPKRAVAAALTKAGVKKK